MISINYSNNAKIRWNEDDLNFLRLNYSNQNDLWIANFLNRSIYSIRSQARILKLRKTKLCLDCGIIIVLKSPSMERCDQCSKINHKINRKKWLNSNKEQIKLSRKIWISKNKDKIKQYDKNYRSNHKNEKRQSDHDYYTKIKAQKNKPFCVDCNQILENKTHKAKRCIPCSKKHKNLFLKKYRLENRDKYLELSRVYTKKRTEKKNLIRKQLGLPLIGSYFKKEQELLFYIQNLFSNYKIIYHDRSILGNGWELDIFIPELNLAFEYNGRQHFDFASTGYWRDYDEFIAQKDRDLLKKVLCKFLDIKLIEINYYENLSEQLILEKLNQLGMLNVIKQYKLDNFRINVMGAGKNDRSEKNF